jgi:hypothetical protein
MGGNYAELKMYGSESGVGYRKEQEKQQQHHREEDDEFHTREASTDLSVLFRLSLLSVCVCGGHEGCEHAVTVGVLYIVHVHSGILSLKSRYYLRSKGQIHERV